MICLYAADHGELCGTGAMADGGVLVILAYYAAVVPCIGSLNSVDADITVYVAVTDGTARAISRNPANIFVTSDAGIGEGDVLHLGSFGDTAEETLTGALGSAALIDADTVDGVALAVEVPFEVINIIADGCIVFLGAGGIVPCGGVGVSDVGTKYEVFAVVIIALVDVVGQQVEAESVGDDVGLLPAAAVAATPAVGQILTDANSVAALGHQVEVAGDVIGARSIVGAYVTIVDIEDAVVVCHVHLGLVGH